MAKVLVVTSGKGGVGKTTSTAALGAAPEVQPLERTLRPPAYPERARPTGGGATFGAVVADTAAASFCGSEVDCAETREGGSADDGSSCAGVDATGCAFAGGGAEAGASDWATVDAGVVGAGAFGVTVGVALVAGASLSASSLFCSATAGVPCGARNSS